MRFTIKTAIDKKYGAQVKSGLHVHWNIYPELLEPPQPRDHSSYHFNF